MFVVLIFATAGLSTAEEATVELSTAEDAEPFCLLVNYLSYENKTDFCSKEYELCPEECAEEICRIEVGLCSKILIQNPFHLSIFEELVYP